MLHLIYILFVSCSLHTAHRTEHNAFEIIHLHLSHLKSRTRFDWFIVNGKVNRLISVWVSFR